MFATETGKLRLWCALLLNDDVKMSGSCRARSCWRRKSWKKTFSFWTSWCLGQLGRFDPWEQPSVFENCSQRSVRFSGNSGDCPLNNSQLRLLCTPTGTPTSIGQGCMGLYEIVCCGHGIIQDCTWFIGIYDPSPVQVLFPAPETPCKSRGLFLSTHNLPLFYPFMFFLHLFQPYPE